MVATTENATYSIVLHMETENGSPWKVCSDVYANWRLTVVRF